MKRGGVLYILFTSVVFAAMEPTSKLLAGQIDALTLTFLRFLEASVLLLPIAIGKLRKHQRHIGVRECLLFGVQGILCVVVSMGLLQLAVFRANSPALIAVVFSTNSVLTILFAAMLLGERITPLRAMAIVLCMSGVALGGVGANGERADAILLALGAAVAMSLFTVLGKKLMKGTPPEVQIGIAFPIGTVVLGAVLLVSGRIGEVRITGATGWGIVLFLGLVVTGLGYISYFKAMENAGAFMASMVFFIKPILAPLMSLWILGASSVGPTPYLSVALVVVGSAAMLLDARKRAD